METRRSRRLEVIDNMRELPPPPPYAGRWYWGEVRDVVNRINAKLAPLFDKAITAARQENSDEVMIHLSKIAKMLGVDLSHILPDEKLRLPDVVKHAKVRVAEMLIATYKLPLRYLFLGSHSVWDLDFIFADLLDLAPIYGEMWMKPVFTTPTQPLRQLKLCIESRDPPYPLSMVVHVLFIGISRGDIALVADEKAYRIGELYKFRRGWRKTSLGDVLRICDKETSVFLVDRRHYDVIKHGYIDKLRSCRKRLFKHGQ